MSTYRIDGIKYNPANWAALDPSERAACNRFAAARERELNTITATPWVCHGGPFAGSKIEIESTTDHTAPMTVGAWCGRYELTGDAYKKDTQRRLEWKGNNAGAPVNTHGSATTSKAAPEVTGKGYEALRDLLAELLEDPSERAEVTTEESKPAKFMASVCDDFGQVVECNSWRGSWDVTEDHIPTHRSGRTTWKARKATRTRANPGAGMYAPDDFGNLFQVGALRTYTATWTVARVRATYTIGRARFSVRATPEGIAAFRARLIKAKRWFSDKMLAAPKVTAEPAEPCAPDVAAVVAASVAIATAQASAKEKTIPGSPWERESETRDHWANIACSREKAQGFFSDIMEAMAQTKTEGLFYNTETYPRCAAIMLEKGYPDASAETERDGVTNAFGSHCYLANDALRRIAAAKHDAESHAALRPYIGQKLGTLVFSDFKRTTGVTVTGVTESGHIQFTGKRGSITVGGTGAAADIRAAIERAHERSQRKTGFSEFTGAAPEAQDDTANVLAIIAASIAIGTAQATVASQQTDATDAQSEELAIVDAPDHTEDASGTPAAHTPEVMADAVAQADTPANDDGSDCTGAHKTRAQAGDYTASLKTQALTPTLSACRDVADPCGTWRATLHRDTQGRPALEFEGPDGHTQQWAFNTRRERAQGLRDLADLARRTDAGPDDWDAAFNADTLDEAMQAAETMTAGDMEATADRLEDINHHGAALMWRCIAAKALDLAQRAADNVSAHRATGDLTQHLQEQRAAISAELHARKSAPIHSPPSSDRHTMNPTTPMTGAELQTLREASGLTREALASLAGVEARTVKHWETRKGTAVPADVGALAQATARWVRETAAEGVKQAVAALKTQAPHLKYMPPLEYPMLGLSHEVVLIRYRETEHLAETDRAQGLRADVHGAMVARLVLDLLGEGFTPRVVWFDPEAFTEWRQAITPTLPDSHALRGAWAAEAISTAIPHPGDQPPPPHTPRH
jgi:DNA-binding transcriptional regulator YiaG